MNKEEENRDIPVPEPLVEVTRGSLTESRHRGHIAVLDSKDEVRAFLGVPETVTYLRSSAKPFQTLPLVASGAADHFALTPQEIAVACASHNGEQIHTEAVASILSKIGLTASALKCGVHEPFSKEVTQALRERAEQPNVLQNNCSGKHAGMLALALYLDAPLETYDQPDHPVQLMIGRTVAQFSGVPIEDIAVGTDGCGAPVFGITVRAMALMYARLVAPPTEFEERTRAACRRIVKAMTEYPEMIGGGSATEQRLDTLMMRAGGGRLISKIGAEGVYTVGVLPSERWPQGLGLALKIEDGEDRRARPTVVIESLRQLGVLEGEALAALAPYASFPVRNHRGEQVGEVRPSFDLKFVGGN
jgi:L-asparaginase II